MSVEGISITSRLPSGASRYLCCGSSNLHRVFASSHIVETYSSNLLVFPAVDLNDLLVAVGVTVTVGGGGRTTGGGDTSMCGSGSSLSWVIGSLSTCWSWGVSTALTGDIIGRAAGWLVSAGRYDILSGCLWSVFSSSWL